MDLMDKECALNNYIDIIKAHIEGKTVLTKNKITNEEWEKLPNDFIHFDFIHFKYKIIPEYVPFETSKEVVENIRGRMIRHKNKNNIYYSISCITKDLIIFNGEYNTTSLTFDQAFDLLEFDDGEPFGKLKE